MKISNLQSSNSDIQFNIHNFQRQKTISEKIHTKARKIFRSLLYYQNALAGAFLSYMAIQVGIAAAELTFGGELINNISNCEKILCKEWNNNTENEDLFSPIVKYRCNSTFTNVLPPYSFELCLNDLCSYVEKAGKNFSLCKSTFKSSNVKIDINISDHGFPYSNPYMVAVWGQLCPNKDDEFLDLREKSNHINECLKKLCDHYAFYKINLPLDNFIVEHCQITNLKNLVKTVGTLTSIIKESQEKAEGNDWTRVNLVASLTGALTGLLTSAFSLVGTIFSYRTAQSSSTAIEIIPTLSSGLRNVMQSVISTSNAVIGTSVAGVAEPIFPLETLEVISEISDSMSYYSAFSFEHPATSVSPDMNIIQANRADLISSITGVNVMDVGEEISRSNPSIHNPAQAAFSLSSFLKGAILSFGGIIGFCIGISISEIIKFIYKNKNTYSRNNNNLESLMYTATDAYKIFTEDVGIEDLNTVTMSVSKNLNSSLGEFDSSLIKNIDPEYFRQMVQNYLNDYMVHISKGSDIFIKQVFRLRDSLQYWQNALCVYYFPRKLACRLPNPNQLSDYIPFDNLNNMFSENTMGLCYLLQNQLWCDWGKFLDTMHLTRNLPTDEINCSYDQIVLQIKEVMKGTYQMHLQGSKENCYNETLTIIT